jgi:hypothetical protein
MAQRMEELNNVHTEVDQIVGEFQKEQHHVGNESTLRFSKKSQAIKRRGAIHLDAGL